MDNIHVVVRVRPLNNREITANQGISWMVKENSIVQCTNSGKPIPSNTYAFDHIYWTKASSKEIYKRSAEGLVKSTLDGINATIFAYGQTSSGKTHTMFGGDQQPGIIPLGIRDLFESVEQNPNREYLFRVSYMEIYNEFITDLLKPDNCNLKIHENLEKGVYVGDLTEEIVMSPEQVLSLMERGTTNRHVGATKMNEQSSRSHTIFRVVVESRQKDEAAEECEDALNVAEVTKPSANSDDGVAVKVACLNLVDLAGSERSSQTGAEGVRLREGGHINKSLLTLGTVIGKLSEGHAGHIPYRDSKLTRILQPALGGNSRTAIIATITPASMHVDETLSTLKFATRAKCIKTNAHVNEVVNDEALLRRYRKEINTLKKQLEQQTDPTISDAVSKSELLEQQLAAEQESKKKMEEKIQKLTSMFVSASSVRTLPADEDSIALAGKKGKKSKPDRRETWCPGEGPSPAFLMELQAARESALAAKAAAAASESSSPGEASEAESEPPSLEENDTMADEHSSSPSEMTATPSKDTLRAHITSLQDKLHKSQEDIKTLASHFSLSEEQLSSPGQPLALITEQLETLKAERESSSFELKKMSEFTALQEAELQKLKLEMMSIAEEKEDMATRVEECERELQQMQVTNEESSLERDEQKAFLEELQASLDDYSMQCLDLEKINSELQKQVSELSEKLSVSPQSIQDKEHGRFPSAEVEDSDLQEQLENEIELREALQSDVNTMESEIEELKAKLSMAEADLEDKKRGGDELSQSQEGRFVKTITALEATISSLNQAAIEAETQLKEFEVNNQGLRTSLDSTTAENSELREQIQSLTIDLGLAQASATDARKLEEMVAAKDSLESQLLELQMQIDRFQLNETEHLEKISVLQVQETERQVKCDQLQEALQKREMQAESVASLSKEEQANLQSEIDRLTTSTAELSKKLVQANSQCEKSSNLAASWEQKFKLMEEERVTIEKDLDVERASHSKDVLDMREKLKSVQDELKLMKREFNSGAASRNASAKQAEQAEKETNRMKMSLEKSEEKLKSAAEAKSKLIQEKAALERELQDLRRGNTVQKKELDKIQRSWDSKLKEHADSLAAKESSIAELQQAINGLNSTQESLQGEVSKFKSMQESTQATLEEVRESLRISTEEKSALEGSIATLSQERQGLEDKLDEQMKVNSSLEEEVQAFQISMSEARDSFENQAQVLREKETVISELEAQIPEFTSCIATKDEQILDMESALRDRLEEGEMLQEKLNTTAVSLSELTEENMGLKKSIEDLNEKEEKRTQELEKEALEKELLTESLSELHLELEEKKNAIEQMKQQFAEHSSEWENQCSLLTEENSSLLAQLNDSKTETSSISAQLESLRVEKDNVENQLKSTDDQSQQIREELLKATEQSQRLQETCDAQTSQMEELRNEISNLQGDVAIKESTITTLSSKVSELNGEISDLNEFSEMKESEILQLQNIINEMEKDAVETRRMNIENKLDKYKEKLRVLGNDYKLAQCQNTSLQQQLREAQEQLALKETEITQLKDETSDPISPPFLEAVDIPHSVGKSSSKTDSLELSDNVEQTAIDADREFVGWCVTPDSQKKSSPKKRSAGDKNRRQSLMNIQNRLQGLKNTGRASLGGEKTPLSFLSPRNLSDAKAQQPNRGILMRECMDIPENYASLQENI